MMRIIVVCVVGLAMGLGGAVGIVLSREKQVRAAATALLADSLAKAAEDSTQAADSMPEAVVGDSVSLVAPVDLLPDVHAPVAGEPADSSAAAVTVASSPAEEERLSRIFAAMRPKEAALVLVNMSNSEVQRLLGHLKERQAAAILSSLPPERAAEISRAVIRGERSGL